MIWKKSNHLISNLLRVGYDTAFSKEQIEKKISEFFNILLSFYSESVDILVSEILLEKGLKEKSALTIKGPNIQYIRN